jgi:hypothetical protein
VYLEHIVYSSAIAVIVGMIYFQYTARDPSWIIIGMAFVPDIDGFVHFILHILRFSLPFNVHHGDFHNIMILIIFSLIIATILTPFGIRFFDGLICSAIGFAAHLFEDALVYKIGYAFFWPITTEVFGIGILSEDRNFFGIANNFTLALGIILLIGVIYLRTRVQGIQWWRQFLNSGEV